MKKRILAFPIKELEPHQIFVFGSNGAGFHGLGAAGQAMRGDGKTDWNKDTRFKIAMSSPKGSPNRVGLWAVFGVARGYQVGTDGASYAVETIAKAGVRPNTKEEKSIVMRSIYSQLVDLVAFGKQHSEKEFLVTALGTELAGLSKEDMGLVWSTVDDRHGVPDNFIFVHLPAVKR